MNPSGWSVKKNVLTKTFEFDNFVSAVKFVTKIVPVAEALNHHPDIEIFSYNKVRIKLTTHDVGNKVTEKDKQLAEKIEKIK